MNITPETVFRRSEELHAEVFENSDLTGKIIGLSLWSALCAGLYGFTMGIHHSPAQSVSSLIKVPLLFAATLLISIAPLHFIGLFLGSRLSFAQTLTLLLWGTAVMSVLLAGFAPVSLFFLLSGSGYAFMLLLHVSIFAFCGLAGLATVHRNMRRLDREPAGGANQRYLLLLWMFLYMFVGTQMAYTLSPFLGKESEFVIIGGADGNFYSHVLESIGELFK